MGRVLEGLEESGYGDNTIVVLWSDHGWQFGEKKHWAKFTLWERATRVNLIFAGPGIVQGKSSAASVNLLDLYPTLADLVGLELPKNQIEGRALTPLLSEPGREWPFPSGYMNHAVRNRHWRYIRYQDGSEELYDPREWTNLAHDPAYRKVIASLASGLPSQNARQIKGKSLPRVRALP